MTNALTKVSNGRIANNVLNVIANTAGMIGSAIALTTTIALFTPASSKSSGADGTNTMA